MEINDLVIVPATLGLTEVTKILGVDSKYAPVIALFIAVGLTFLIDGVSGLRAVLGIVYGLAASGLYSGPKAISKEVNPALIS